MPTDEDEVQGVEEPAEFYKVVRSYEPRGHNASVLQRGVGAWAQSLGNVICRDLSGEYR